MGHGWFGTRDRVTSAAALFKTWDMRSRSRLALLITLTLLGTGLWRVLQDPPLVDTLPDHTVLNRLPAVNGDAADVLIPSLSRAGGRREEIFRAIVATEGLNTAFFFSTEEALDAHQAFLPSPDQLDDLKAGFLGQVRDGDFTPGEDLYPG